MQIHVGRGIGSGPTTMAAFDSALNEVGIANYNMLRLSSVVPPNSNITVHDGKIAATLPGSWGDRLYVVMAEQRESEPGVQAWAGVGWVQDKKTGRGMFTEHEGSSEEFVKLQIRKSLESFMKIRSKEEDFEWGEIRTVVTGGKCGDQPICAMVAAAFQVSDWNNRSYFLGGE